MHFTCRSFIGSPDSRHWCQYWENEPDDPSLSSQKGHLFGLISLSTDHDSPSLNATGRDLITEINQLYYQPSSDISIPRNLLRTLENLSQNPLYQSFHLSFILAIVLDDRLHLAISQAGVCFLCRGKQISLLLSSENEPVKTISGPVQSEDRLFLASADFYRQFPFDDIRRFLSETNLSLLEENILSAMHSANSSVSPATAGVFIQIHEVTPLSAVVPTDVGTKADRSVSPVTHPKLRFNLSFFKKIFPRRSIYIQKHDPLELQRRRRLNLVTSFLVLVFIIIGISFAYIKNQRNQAEHRYQQLKTELEAKIASANTIRNLNLDNARELAQEAKSLFDQITKLRIHPKDLPSYHDQITSLLSQTGAIDTFTPDFFYDTSLIIDPPHFTRLFLNSPRLYLLDSQTGRLDTLDIQDKSIKNLTPKLEIQSTLGFVISKQIVYLYSQQGIFRFFPNNLEKIIDFTAKSINPVDIEIWNDNFYVLDSNNSTIWKLNPQGSAIDDKNLWLKSNQSLPANPSSLAINGQIWVLSQNGTIISYTRGVKDNYSQAQVSATQAKHLATNLDNDLLVFVDSGNIIYLFDKTGKSLAKYHLSSLTVSDLVFDGQTKTLYLLCTDQKIYKISL